VARPKSWLSTISQILAAAETGPERYDRRAIEGLFRISATQAKDLMPDIGAIPDPTGKLTVSRENLLAYLKFSPDAADALRESERRKKLAKKLKDGEEELKLRRVVIPLQPGDRWSLLGDLEPLISNVAPEGGKPGQFTIDYTDTDDLLRTLYRLGQAIVNEIGEEQFRRLTSPVMVKEKAERMAG
jgi:hypothetical protein